MGVDPGTRRLGWGVVDKTGSHLRCVAAGVITPPDGALADRLLVIEDSLRAVVAEHRPEAAAVEGIFFAKDPQSACKLGHARGVALVCLRRSGIEVFEYAPARVKRAVAGSGRADKRQVAMVVAGLLGLSEPPPSDAADALAIAITHHSIASFDAAVARALAR